MKQKLLFFSIALAALLSVPQYADAAIGFRGSAENSSAPSTDTTVDLTTISGLAQGDLVIVAASVGDNDNLTTLETLNNSAGYTKLNQVRSTADVDDAHLSVWYKIMTATPDSSVVIEGTGPGTDAAMAVVVMAFSGVDQGTPFDVASTSVTGINTSNPDPPSINHNNPSGVWTVIAGGNGHIAGGLCTFTFPTGYTTNAIDRGQDDTFDTTVGMGYNSSPSDPEDPGVMTHSCADSADNAWAAFTMALRPAVTVAPTVTTGSASAGVLAAVINGNITVTGGANSTVRGFAWGTSATLVNGGAATTTETGSFGVAAFSKIVSGLIAGKQYFFRAYATNSAGTGYGSIANFTAGTDTAPSRKVRIFEGYNVRVLDGGRLIVR